MRKLKNYLTNLPQKKLLQINSIAVWGLLIYIVFLNDKIKSTDLTFLIITPLIWCGGSFFFLALLIQLLNQDVKKILLKKTMIALCFIIILITFFGPIVCYFMAKNADFEIEHLKQVMHHT